MSLSDSFKDTEKRARVVEDCVLLVDSEVGKKKGLGGVVIKAGYGAVKGIKPGFIHKVVDGLFDRWAAKIDPFWDGAVAAGKDPGAQLVAQKDQVADALLQVTDEKAQRADSALVSSTYKKLRPSAKEHVMEAMPGLVAILAKHAKA
jgi:hypothetical protein